MLWRVLILLSITAAYTDAQNDTRCFECTDVPHPQDCTIVTLCASGQTCVVEQFITSGGMVLFNSGCQSRTRCNMNRRREVPTREYSHLSKREDIVTCDECCTGDFCNDKGCGSIALKMPQRGALCFQCEEESDPKNCRTLEKCDFGNVCMLSKLRQKGPAGDDLFKSACVSPRVCQAYALLGRRRNTYCHVCCDSDYCNDRCEELVTPAPTLPPTTTTTTTTTTRPPTTTTTTTTTTTRPTTTTKRPTTKHQPTHAEICNHRHYHYDRHSDLCYKFHYDTKDWDHAASSCKAEHAQLAIVDTSAKWNVLKAALQNDDKLQHQRVYIGAKDTANDAYAWVDGTKLTFADWDAGQPGGGSGENCVYLRDTADFRWHDTACSGQAYAYICTVAL